jgi:hypothetical protein
MTDAVKQNLEQECIAFAGVRAIASGPLLKVALQTKEVIDAGEADPILIFNYTDSKPIEIDFRGSSAVFEKRILELTAQSRNTIDASPPEIEAAENVRGPGRPKLGVIPREVTLLPRHWDWLNTQPGGASVALRKLVEEAKRVHAHKDGLRVAQESTYTFISTMAGNMNGFEEATRALFAGDAKRFANLIELWPIDIVEHTKRISAAAFE